MAIGILMPSRGHSGPPVLPLTLPKAALCGKSLLCHQGLVNVIVQLFSHIQPFVNLWTAAHRASPSFTSSGACSNSCLLSQWCHPAISFSDALFSSCPQSFPASGSFPVSWLFPSGGQRIGTSASASVLPMNSQGWFPLGWTGLTSLLSKGLSRVFSSTIIQKHPCLQGLC